MKITYSGGPIVKCPLVYNSFWGPKWTDAAHQTLAGQLNQFQQDLLNSNFMNVLTQYGVLIGAGTGALIQPQFLPGVPSTLTVASYQAIIQSCIDGGFLPDPGNPTNNILMIYLDDNTVINDPSTGRVLNTGTTSVVGYHDHFTTSAGSPLYYAFMSYGSTPGSVTWYASHEFAEMITDPEYTAWTPDGGFTEIGDVCEGSNDTITVGGNSWTVQKMWSDTDNACVGQATSPLPPLSPGPAMGMGMGMAAGPGSVSRPAPLPSTSHARLLPLPPIVIDLHHKSATFDPAHVRAYANRLFQPAHHAQIVADLPKLLRQFADFIEVKPRSPKTPTARGQVRAGDASAADMG